MSFLTEEQPSTGAAAGRTPRRWLFVLLAAALFGVDQLTKWLVVTHLHRGEFIRVGPFLQFRYTYNTGVAFGLWATGGKMLAVLALVCIIAVLVWGSRYAPRGWLVGWALAFLVGGAMGNLLDRVRLGHVVDFIDFRFWPVFNWADACVVVGALLLLAHGLFLHEPPPPAAVESCADKEDA